MNGVVGPPRGHPVLVLVERGFLILETAELRARAGDDVGGGGRRRRGLRRVVGAATGAHEEERAQHGMRAHRTGSPGRVWVRGI